MGKILINTTHHTHINSIKEIIEHNDEYIVMEHHNGKTTPHYIPRKNVDVLKQIVRKELDIGEEATYQFMVEKLIIKTRLFIKLGVLKNTLINYFNGGLNRKHYFKYYYYPLKILQALKEIDHSKTGDVLRLK